MTTTTTRVGPGALARIEAKRFARHPLFLVGVALLVWNSVAEALRDPPNVGAFGQPIIPAMTLGVFGLVLAARLTRSTARGVDMFGAPPVPERTRTAALAIACLVPVAVAAVWTLFTLVLYTVNRPAPDAWWWGTLPASDVVAYYLGAGVVAAYGGPILGVVIARWIRWSGAALVAAVLLVAVTVVGSGISEAVRPWRQVFPWTAWYGGDNGAGADTYYPGNPLWWLVYTVCLCAVGVVAALLHDREQPRKHLLVVGAAILAAGLAASVLSMITGPQETLISPPTLHPEQVG